MTAQGTEDVLVHGRGVGLPLLLVAGLSFPTLALSVASWALGSLTGLRGLQEASITLLPLSSLLGCAVVPFGVAAATRLAHRQSMPQWAARAALLLALLGALLQVGLMAALMTRGLIELP